MTLDFSPIIGSPAAIASPGRRKITFTTPSSGNYVIDLDWDHSNPYDADLYVYFLPIADGSDQDPYADTVASAFNIGDLPEQVTFPSSAGTEWMCDFPFWDFFPDTETPYRATFLVTPE